jgi:cyclic dehypoxanthinyl futalosine synthase
MSKAALNEKRLTRKEAIALLKNAPLLELGRMADDARRRRHSGKTVTFVIDRNINYTNICINRCRFCAYFRDAGHPESYLLSRDEIFGKIAETVALGGTQILLQGGLHPDLNIEYFEDLFRAIKSRFDINLHALSAPEIFFIAKQSGLSVPKTLARLKAAGLGSIPGAGAEILSDRVREAISPKKIKTAQWLGVMEAAHRQGIRSTATMMFGSGEEPDDIIAHLDAIRRLQDRTGGFTAFIPWTFQPSNTDIDIRPATGADYLRVLALSRVYLDNMANIQASWVTQGIKMAELSLRFGANDLGSTMIEENVVAAAGVSYRVSMEELVEAAHNAGFRAAQRDTFYKIIKRF